MFHFIRVAHAAVREALKRRKRSPGWAAVERAWLAENPACAACGGVARLQVHHKVPFAVDPSKELDVTNLVTLCMGPPECHLRIGHGGSFRAWNPRVGVDVLRCRTEPGTRKIVEDAARVRRRAMG